MSDIKENDLTKYENPLPISITDIPTQERDSLLEVYVALLEQTRENFLLNPHYSTYVGVVCYETVVSFLNGKLSENQDFIVYKMSEVDYLIAHKDFLQIQDEHQNVEPASIQALSNYFPAYREAFSFQELIRTGALASLPDSKRLYELTVDPSLNQHKHFLVAVPAPVDNQDLWTGLFHFPKDLLDKIPPTTRMSSSGLLLASRVGRTNSRGCNDFFQARIFDALSAKISVDEAVTKLGKHEGSHGIIDTTVSKLTNSYPHGPNLLSEGLAEALSGGLKVRRSTRVGIEEFLAEPKYLDKENLTDDEKELRQFACYETASRVLYSIKECLALKNELSNTESRSLLVSKLFSSALTLKNDPEFMKLQPNIKNIRLIKTLIEELDINIKDILAYFNMCGPVVS